MRADEVIRIDSCAEELHKPYAERGERKPRYVLVGAERNRKERINQRAERRHERRKQQRRKHQKESHGRAVADRRHINGYAPAAAERAHAHDARNTEIQMPRFFHDRFARAAEKENGAHANGFYK